MARENLGELEFLFGAREARSDAVTTSCQLDASPRRSAPSPDASASPPPRSESPAPRSRSPHRRPEPHLPSRLIHHSRDESATSAPTPTLRRRAARRQISPPRAPLRPFAESALATAEPHSPAPPHPRGPVAAARVGHLDNPRSSTVFREPLPAGPVRCVALCTPMQPPRTHTALAALLSLCSWLGTAFAQTDYEAAMSQAARLEAAGPPREAAAAIDRLSADFPDDYALALRLGWLWFSANEYRTAQRHYTHALTLSHDTSVDARLGLAWCLLRLADPAAARAAFATRARRRAAVLSAREGLRPPAPPSPGCSVCGPRSGSARSSQTGHPNRTGSYSATAAATMQLLESAVLDLTWRAVDYGYASSTTGHPRDRPLPPAGVSRLRRNLPPPLRVHLGYSWTRATASSLRRCSAPRAASRSTARCSLRPAPRRPPTTPSSARRARGRRRSRPAGRSAPSPRCSTAMAPWADPWACARRATPPRVQPLALRARPQRDPHRVARRRAHLRDHGRHPRRPLARRAPAAVAVARDRRRIRLSSHDPKHRLVGCRTRTSSPSDSSPDERDRRPTPRRFRHATTQRPRHQ